MAATVFSRSFLQQLISTLPFPVHVFSGGGKTLYQNVASRELRKIMALDGHLAAVHPDDRQTCFTNWEKALLENSSVEHEMRYLYPGADYRAVTEKIIIVDGFRTGIIILKD
jgi:hypothetical protein